MLSGSLARHSLNSQCNGAGVGSVMVHLCQHRFTGNVTPAWLRTCWAYLVKPDLHTFSRPVSPVSISPIWMFDSLQLCDQWQFPLLSIQGAFKHAAYHCHSASHKGNPLSGHTWCGWPPFPHETTAPPDPSSFPALLWFILDSTRIVSAVTNLSFGNLMALNTRMQANTSA